MVQTTAMEHCRGSRELPGRTTGSGSNAQAHGFTWRPGHGFRTVDDPHGIGATTVNEAGVLVGSCTDGAGHADGMIALPR